MATHSLDQIVVLPSTGIATPLRGSTVVSLMQHCHLVLKYFHYTMSILDNALQKKNTN